MSQAYKVSGIYQITNKLNGRKYIGYTERNCTSRWYQHIYDLKHNKHDNYKLQEDFNMHDITVFTFEILELLVGKDNLLKVEQKYINQIDFDKDYNLINSSLADADLNVDEKHFIDYVNKKWLVPKGIISKKELDKYKIYKEEDKQEIIKMVYDCRLLKLYLSQITFNKVVNFMQENLGYVIESSRIKLNKRQYTYKLIVDFDEDKINIDVGGLT